MSNMYSLLNYIAATSQEIFESSSQQLLHNPLYTPPLTSTDQLTFQSDDAGLRGRSDEEKRLIGITTISIVTRLALEFDKEEVTKLTISMLLQRLRTAEPTVEAAIAYNLVDLALVAPEDAFVDIIRTFSAINRTANPEDPRFSNNMVCYIILRKLIVPKSTGMIRCWQHKPDLLEKSTDDLTCMTRTWKSSSPSSLTKVWRFRIPLLQDTMGRLAVVSRLLIPLLTAEEFTRLRR